MMVVYVDDYRTLVRVGRIKARWSHMMGDTLDELLCFADSLGLKREWLQDKPSGVHFDVIDSKRVEAIRLGAVPIVCGEDKWRRVVDEARQQHSGLRRPRRFPVEAPTGSGDLVDPDNKGTPQNGPNVPDGEKGLMLDTLW